MQRKEIGIIGGGASGMMAAIAAADSMKGRPCEIVILEKKDRVGKKLLATGNGKCNLTNLSFSVENPGSYYRSRNPELLSVFFARFGVEDTLRQFERLGMLVTDKNGYVYPLSGQAATVLDTLRFALEERNIRTITECRVEHAEYRREGRNTGFYIQAQGESYWFRRLILACGSTAGEKTEDMGGYELAGSFGHSLIRPLPALVQLRCAGSFWKGLAGVRCDAGIRLIVEEKRDGKVSGKEYDEQGELQLTDYGISGIPVFQLSRFASAALAEGRRVKAFLDFLPGFCGKEEIWNSLIEKKSRACHGRSMEVLFNGLVNKKIIQTVWKLNGLHGEDIVSSGTLVSVKKVFAMLRRFEVTVTASNPFANAQVCAGGVPLTEVDSQLRSRCCQELYLAGELLDVDGRCGGYNLQWAWTSGYLAGRAAGLSL